MLFRDFCNEIEMFTTPSNAREQVENLFSQDDPALIIKFLMGKPLGNKKIGISRQIVSNILTKHGINIDDFTNPGDACKNLCGESRGMSLIEVSELYKYLAENDKKGSNLNYLLLNYFDDVERKVFVNILLNKHQNKVGWGVIKYSLSQFYNYSLDQVDGVYRTTQSIDKTIAILKGEHVEQGIGIPIMSQLSSVADLKKLTFPLIAEPKLDGFRAQIHINDGIVKIFSGRNIESDKTNSFPDIVKQVTEYPNGIYDGEIVGFRHCRIYTFNELQHRINSKDNIAELVEKYPAKFFAFDLLHDGEEFIIDQSFVHRRFKLVDKLLTDTLYCEVVNDLYQALDYYDKCIDTGFEGSMFKTVHGNYYPGEGKSGHTEWFKYKPARFDIDCIIMSAKYGTGKDKDVLASFEVGVFDDEADPIECENPYKSIGWVGTGFTDSELFGLTVEIAPLGDVPTSEEIIDKHIIITVKADCFLKNACRFLTYIGRREKEDIDIWSDLVKKIGV